MADIQKYFAEHLYLGESRFYSRITAGKIFYIMLTNFLLSALTLGIGFSWARVRSAQLYISQISLEGNEDLEQARQIARQSTSAGGEGIAEALDLDMGIGF